MFYLLAEVLDADECGDKLSQHPVMASSFWHFSQLIQWSLRSQLSALPKRNRV